MAGCRTHAFPAAHRVWVAVSRPVPTVSVNRLVAASLIMSSMTFNAADHTARTPVLIELFTSEGCSSCPPADRALAALDREQSIPGAEVMVLGFHVDYWNRLGRADPFSSAEWSALQEDAANELGNNGLFTPEGLVDGTLSVVASNEDKLKAAIARAAHANVQRLEVSTTVDPSGRQVRVQARAPTPLASDAITFVALTESGLTTYVGAGENEGRTLHHAPVVRAYRRVGRGIEQQPMTAVLDVRPEWHREHLQVRVWTIAPETRELIAAGQSALSAAH